QLADFPRDGLVSHAVATVPESLPPVQLFAPYRERRNASFWLGKQPGSGHRLLESPGKRRKCEVAAPVLKSPVGKGLVQGRVAKDCDDSVDQEGAVIAVNGITGRSVAIECLRGRMGGGERRNASAQGLSIDEAKALDLIRH